MMIFLDEMQIWKKIAHFEIFIFIQQSLRQK